MPEVPASRFGLTRRRPADHCSLLAAGRLRLHHHQRQLASPRASIPASQTPHRP